MASLTGHKRVDGSGPIGGAAVARPDCDDGWIKLAHELRAALEISGLNKAARAVLCEVLEQVYGPAKRRAAKLSPSDIGRRFGRPKQWAARGVAELVSGGFLVRDGSGDYSFRKHYAGWRDEHGDGLFTPEELAWIADAPARALRCAGRSGCADPAASTDLMTHQRSSVIKSDDATTKETGCAVNGLDDAASTDLMTFGGSPLTTPLAGMRIVEKVGGSPAPAPAREEPGRMPREAADLICPRADRIPALMGFSARLRGEWESNGKLGAYWVDHPGHPAWTEALNDLAGCDPEKRHPAMYLGIVRRLLRAPAPSATVTPAPRRSPAALRREARIEEFRAYAEANKARRLKEERDADAR